MRLIRGLLPTDVRVRETTSDFGELLPPEQEHFRAASGKRVREATTVRACARELLDAEGFEEHSLVPGADGVSLWPAGIAGSLTHCRGFRAAAIGARRSYAAIGIDAEPAIPLSTAALEAVRCPTDTSALTHPLWSTILFSAKETAFKAWSASGATALHVLDISIALEVSGRFRATAPSYAVGICGLAGQWRMRNQHVATAAVIREQVQGA